MNRKLIYSILVISAFFLINTGTVNAQVLISNTGGSPDESAMLEIQSNSKGLLIPRLTTAQRLALNTTADEGLLVYDSDLQCFYIYGKKPDETVGWYNISNHAAIWSRSDTMVYLSQDNYNVGIGTSTPNKKLVIQADNDTDTLLEVQDKDGNPLMVITPKLTKFNFIETSKGIAGGFAVHRYNQAKDGKDLTDTALFIVTPDSTRVYSFGTSGVAGGFATGRYAAAKGVVRNYMFMVPDNYLIGHQAGELLQKGIYSGKYNTFFGYQAGVSDTIGGSNVFIGYRSGYSNTGERITSPSVDTLGSRNVFLGYEAGFNNTIGSDNVLLGYQAGYNVTTAGNNISIGSKAGYNNENNSDNIFFGRESGYNHTGDGSANSSINNIYIGLQAGYGHAAFGNEGSNNTFIGTQAGYTNNVGDNNIFIGKEAGYSNRGHSSGTYGDNNIFLGNEAGRENWYGERNIFIGYQAGRNSGSTGSNSASNNIFIGDSSGYSNTTGNDNIFIGNRAGKKNEVGVYNTIIGEGAGENIVGWMVGLAPKGSHNVFIGKSAGNSSTGLENTYIGGSCARYNVHGQKNVIMGRYATFWSEGGSRNVIIGYNAGNLDPFTQDSVGDGNIFIGYEAGLYQEVSNELFIDNSSTSTPLIHGDFSTNTLTVYSNLNVNNAYTFPTTDGSSNQVLSTDGSGNVSWNTVGGTLVTAGNGLNFDEAPRVELGGSLNETTVISQGNNNFSFNLNGTGDFYVTSGLSTYVFVGNNAGWLGVGTNSPRSKLTVDGRITPYTDNSDDIGSASYRWDDIYATNGVIQTSDSRLKENIDDLQYGLEDVMKLKPVTFNWIDKPEKGTKIGFLAQELNMVIKEAVYEDEEGKTDILGVNYADLVPVLTKAIQEQQIEIEKEKAKNKLQQQEINELRREINELKDLINK